MPKPKKGEGRSEYLHRAIPQIMDEGKTQEQAVGQAEGMYDSAKKAMIAETPVEMTERSVGPGLANPEDGGAVRVHGGLPGPEGCPPRRGVQAGEDGGLWAGRGGRGREGRLSQA